MKRFVGAVTDFGLAWQLLTILPWPFGPDRVSRPAGRAAAYFPLIGLVIGLLLAGLSWLLFGWLPEGVSAALVMAIWVALTGMLHLDGFMDACDGLLPPREASRRLEIMRDSRVGAFAVVGVVLLLLVKFNALAALPLDDRPWALVATPVLSRWALTWSMARYPLAREEGLSVFFEVGLGRWQVGVASITAVAITAFCWGAGGAVLVGVTWLVTSLVARLAVVRIGGLTGDVYGAICELTEVVLLVTVIILAW